MHFEIESFSPKVSVIFHYKKPQNSIVAFLQCFFFMLFLSFSPFGSCVFVLVEIVCVSAFVCMNCKRLYYEVFEICTRFFNMEFKVFFICIKQKTKNKRLKWAFAPPFLLLLHRLLYVPLSVSLFCMRSFFLSLTLSLWLLLCMKLLWRAKVKLKLHVLVD